MGERRVQTGRNRKVKYAAYVKTIMPQFTRKMREARPLYGIRHPMGRETLNDSTIEAVDNPPS